MEVNWELHTLRALPQGKDTTIQLNNSLCEHMCNNYTRLYTVSISVSLMLLAIICGMLEAANLNEDFTKTKIL